MSDQTTSLTKEDLYRAVRKLRAVPRPQPLPVQMAMSTAKLRELFKSNSLPITDEDIAAGGLKAWRLEIVLQEHLGEMVSIAMDNGGFLLWNGRAWLRIPPLEMVREMRVTEVTWE